MIGYFNNVFKIDENYSDSAMFMISMVPLRLIEDPELNREVWKHDRPSSVQHCRPIEFSYIKESKEVIIEKHKYIKDQIEKLKDTLYITNEGSKIKIRHVLHFTMVDGKVAQAISGKILQL